MKTAGAADFLEHEIIATWNLPYSRVAAKWKKKLHDLAYESLTGKLLPNAVLARKIDHSAILDVSRCH